MRPYARASLYHYFHGDESGVRAGLLGASQGVEAMTVHQSMGQNQQLVEFGLDYITLSGMATQLRYERTMANDLSSKQAVLKLSFPF